MNTEIILLLLCCLTCFGPRLWHGMHHPCEAQTLGAATYNQPWMFETREFDQISQWFPYFSTLTKHLVVASCDRADHTKGIKKCGYNHSINNPWNVLSPRPGLSFLWSHRRRFRSSGWLCLKNVITKKRGEIRSKVLSKQELELALAIKRPQILQSLMN